MADPNGFLNHKRVEVDYRAIDQRVEDYNEVEVPMEEVDLLCQASRCMDCGIPFCHGIGCPLANRIPEFNDYVYNGRWKEALAVLHATNNFPEFTGRICPAPCETSCTLNIDREPVLIRHIECQIAERGFAEGWIKPELPAKRTGKSVAVIGSGPAGLACAQQLARAGHSVVVYERDHRPGGLLRYGIPDFKLDKNTIDRRLDQMEAEGVLFETDVTVGADISARYLRNSFDAVCLTMGACQPRDLEVPGRELDGVHFAMDFLGEQNRVNSGEIEESQRKISAAGKHVVVIGGGDTGSDCVGTSIRHGAVSVTQVEILPQPPENYNPQTPWPQWPQILRTSSSHKEGCERMWSVRTVDLAGQNGKLSELHAVEVEWTNDNGRWVMKDVPDSLFTLKADLVLLAMGFVHVVHKGLVESLDLDLDQRGNIKTDNYMTSTEGVFSAGDAMAGASLVVRAINAGREAAESINNWLAANKDS